MVHCCLFHQGLKIQCHVLSNSLCLRIPSHSLVYLIIVQILRFFPSLKKKKKKNLLGEFPGNPEFGAPSFYCSGSGFNPQLGNQDPASRTARPKIHKIKTCRSYGILHDLSFLMLYLLKYLVEKKHLSDV